MCTSLWNAALQQLMIVKPSPLLTRVDVCVTIESPPHPRPWRSLDDGLLLGLVQDQMLQHVTEQTTRVCSSQKRNQECATKIFAFHSFYTFFQLMNEFAYLIFSRKYEISRLSPFIQFPCRKGCVKVTQFKAFDEISFNRKIIDLHNTSRAFQQRSLVEEYPIHRRPIHPPHSSHGGQDTQKMARARRNPTPWNVWKFYPMSRLLVREEMAAKVTRRWNTAVP